MYVLPALLLVGPAMLSQARRMSSEFRSLASAASAASAFAIRDFVVSDVVFTEVDDGHDQATKRRLSFTFADPNANTTVACADLWFKDAEGDHAPYSYVYCQAPTSSFSIWKFTSFRDGGNFSLAISHHFSDPTHYPPPYSYVQYFGDVDLTPECSTAPNGTRCVAPGPMLVKVTGITN